MTDEQEFDKRPEHNIGMHTNEDHGNDEVIEGDAEINNPEARHRDKLLDMYCDMHPGAPECKVFDD